MHTERNLVSAGTPSLPDIPGYGHADALRPQSFEALTRSFAANIDGLRDFTELVETVLGRGMAKTAKTLLPMAAAFSVLLSDTEWAFPMPSAEHLETIAKKFDLITTKRDGTQSVTLRAKNAAALRQFREARNVLFRRLRHREHLYDSTLVSLVSAVECFFSAMLHLYYHEHIDVLGTAEKRFSLKDLQSFKSIEDAREAIVEDKVEALLRKSFRDWIDYLRKEVKLTASYLDPVEDEMTEVFLRRNLIVHNYGVVNSTYLARVAPKYAAQAKSGQALFVSQAYFERAIDLFELHFMLLAAELWKKLDRGNEERCGVLSQIGYQRMVAQKWSLAGGIYRFIADDKSVGECDRLRGRVNYWQCMKWSGRFEEVRQEVIRADFSDKGTVFRLCLSALRDEVESFFKLLPIALNSGELTASDLREWPIFREMRKRQEFSALVVGKRAPRADGLSAPRAATPENASTARNRTAVAGERQRPRKSRINKRT